MSRDPHQQPERPVETSRPKDPAMESLSEALQVSFRLLSFVMVLFVILFLATGVKSIDDQERGIVKFLGRVTRVAEPGLALNWFFPLGQIETVEIRERRLSIDQFWMYETASEARKELSERRRSREGLRPGYDGYLLTGDRNIVHVRFECVYRIEDVLAYRDTLPDIDPTLKAVLARAAVQSAGQRTADSILRSPREFLDELQTFAQRQIDEIVQPSRPGFAHAIVITQVVLPDDRSITWPLAAYTAYENAQAAEAEKNSQINNAIGEAKSMAKVIGEDAFLQLVGEPWRDPSAEDQSMQADDEAQGDGYDLIGQYERVIDRLIAARRASSTPDAEAQQKIRKLEERMHALRSQIDEILTRGGTGGEVSRLITDAEARKTRTIEDAKRRAQRFEELYVQYRKNPEVFLSKMWADVRDDILDAPTNQKFYYTPGPLGTVLYLSHDPRVVNEIMDYMRAAENQSPHSP